MQRMMLVGETGAGKRALVRALSGGDCPARRTLAVEYCGPFILTPGEFLENRRFTQALITTSADCDVLALLQDATRRGCLFPPGFAALFNRRVVGVVTRADRHGADADRAERFLRAAGVREIVRWGSDDSALDALRALLA